MIIKPEVNFMSRTKKEFDLFLLSFVQIHSHPVSAVLIEFREIGVDPRHECVVILPGQGLTVQIPQGQLLRQQLVEDRILILLDGLVDATVGKGAGGIRLPRYRSTSLGIPWGTQWEKTLPST